MKKIKITIPNCSNISYFYTSDNYISDEERVEKQRLENELVNLVNVTGVGVKNSNSRVTVSKDEALVNVTIDCEDYLLIEEKY